MPALDGGIGLTGRRAAREQEHAADLEEAHVGVPRARLRCSAGTSPGSSVVRITDCSSRSGLATRTQRGVVAAERALRTTGATKA